MNRFGQALVFAMFALACANGTPARPVTGDSAVGCTGCGTNQMCCSNQCIDVSSSEAHCGACGNACEENETCSDGACKCAGQTCGAGTTCCPGVGCVNTDDSAAHCGACGNACATGQVCLSGTCAQLSCNNNQNCESLQVCVNATTCACGSTQAAGRNACPAGQVCVDAAGSTQQNLRRCVNLQTDTGNCGAPGTTCSGATPNCCGGRCVNTQTDPANCGACGQAIHPMRATACADGMPRCGDGPGCSGSILLGAACNCQPPVPFAFPTAACAREQTRLSTCQ